MTGGFIIRDCKPADHGAVRNLIAELQAHECALQSDRLPWEEVEDAYWSWLMKAMKREGSFMFVAEDKGAVEGVIAGWINVDDYPGIAPSEWRYGCIGELMVTESARKKGIGAALVKKAEDFFRRLGLSTMQVSAIPGNKLAIDFYTRYGMEPILSTYKKYLASHA